jgi:hypothetical protein
MYEIEKSACRGCLRRAGDGSVSKVLNVYSICILACGPITRPDGG